MLLVAWVAVVAFVACRLSGDDGRSPSVSGSTRPTARVSAPLDVAAAVARARLAFHPEGNAFVAARASHEVRADARSLSFAPASGPRPTAPLVLDAAVVTRGGARVADGEGAARVDEGGRLLVERDALRERVTNGESDVEQSWTFDRAPPGAGDLVLRLVTHGEELAATTATGLHFRDPAAGRGVRYGEATWIDARGVGTKVAPAYEDGAILLAVPARVIDASAYPATLDPSLTPEREVDQPIFGVSGGYQNAAPAIDFDGTSYFVVWSDSRSGYLGVYGVHVRPDGTPIEPVPVVVSDGASGASPSPDPPYTAASVVAVAFDGTNHLVVYVAYEGSDYVLLAKRVSKAGAVLDATPLRVSPASAAGAQAPSVAFDGSDYLVVWQDARSGSPHVYATRMSVGGSVLNASSVPVSGATGIDVSPKVAPGGGGNAYVVWTHEDGPAGSPDVGSVHGALLASSGAVLAPDVVVAQGTTTDLAFLPDVAGWGGGFLVAYVDAPSNGVSPQGAGTAYVVPVGSDGRPGTRAPLLTPQTPRTSNGVAMFSTPSAAFDGQDFVVAWSTTSQVVAQRVSPLGAPEGEQTFAAMDADEQVAPGGAVVAATPSGAMVASHRVVSPSPGGFARYEVAGVPLDLTTVVGGVTAGAPTALSTGANAEEPGAVAFDGAHYLVVLHDSRAPGSARDLYGVLLDPSGVGAPGGGALDGGGIDAGYPLNASFPIATDADDDYAPRVAFDGTSFLVAWEELSPPPTVTNHQIAAKRVARDGTLLGDVASSRGTTLAPLSGGGLFSLTYDGTAFLLAWGDSVSATSGGVYAEHFTRSALGTPITSVEGTPTLLSSTGIGSTSASLVAPGAATDGASTLVVWVDTRVPGMQTPYATLLADPLAAPDAGAPAFAVGPGATTLLTPGVAYDSVAHAYRVALVAQGSAFTQNLLYVTVQSPTTVSAPVGVTAQAISGAFLPSTVVFDGTESLLFWTDFATLAVRAARVDTNGALLDPGGFAVSDTTSFEPAAASNGAGATLVTYTTYPGDRQSSRVHARVISAVSQEGLGRSCAVASDCASGFCVDGVCCDTACGAGDPTRCSACTVALGAASDGTCAAAFVGRVCRASTSECMRSATCDGTSLTCAPNAPRADGTSCSAGVCVGGVCVPESDAGAFVDGGSDGGGDAAAGDGGVEGGVDAGDASAADAAVDAGRGGIDGGRDAGLDAALLDAASPDGATPVDAGDAGEDAAGPPIVVLDASPPAPADASFATFEPASSGCGCGVAPEVDARAWQALAVCAATALSRRRRRPRRRG